MEFTESELEILFNAWALHARDRVFVPTPEALPDCHRLNEAGWRERRRVDATDDVAYRWTPQAEMALDVNGLTQSVQERQN
jgi:hypothetical protein